jgi:hypothetical protein
VVIGALSPRARNAQVALFQSGEVDTLVATDAIGMGLNLDVDNVVFADLRKFDGRESRRLDDAELAQIAGRAGRHTATGASPLCTRSPPLPPPTVRALERHRFPPDERVFLAQPPAGLIRSTRLLASLRRRPFAPCLRLADDAEDMRAARAWPGWTTCARWRGAAPRVQLLWEVCQIPDFRQLPFDDHFKLLAAVYGSCASPRGGSSAPGSRATSSGCSPTGIWTPCCRDVGGANLDVHHRPRGVGGGRDRLAKAHPRSRGPPERRPPQQLVQRFVDAPGSRGRRGAPKAAPRGAGLRSLAGELRPRCRG